MSHPFRTKCSTGLVAEFLPPRTKSSKVIIFCDGLPSMPSKSALLRYWANKGYWVFHPRYYGTWESEGQFLKDSPEQMVFDLLDVLPNGFQDVWEGSRFSMHPTEVFVVGASFGGAAALLASRDARVKKVVALAPVVDWTLRSEDEPNEYLHDVIRNGYGGSYRFDDADWDRLAEGSFFQPESVIKELDPKKILIVQAKDDRVVLSAWVESFAVRLGCALCVLPKGGHASASWTMRWSLSRKIHRFLTS